MLDIDNLNNFLAQRIAQLRLAKGVSARDMSLTLGQGAGYINSIENKKSQPSMHVFFYICDFFKITPKDFFDVGQNNPELLQALFDKLKTFNQEELESVGGVVDVINKKKL